MSTHRRSASGAVEPSDLDAIVAIDEKLSGQTRKEYWQRRLDIAALRPPWMSLVAETDGRLVGLPLRLGGRVRVRHRPSPPAGWT